MFLLKLLGVSGVALLAASLITTTANAEVLIEGYDQDTYLDQCGGYARLVTDRGTPFVAIRGSRFCNAIQVNRSQPQWMRQGHDGTFQTRVRLNESQGNRFRIKVYSTNSGYGRRPVADNINVRLQSGGFPGPGPGPQRPPMRPPVHVPQTPRYQWLEPNAWIHFGASSLFKNDTKSSGLSECGGQIVATASPAGVKVEFHGVTRCMFFDIISVNGEKVYHRDQVLNRGNGLNGQFHIPSQLFSEGRNVIKLIVQSRSGRRDDVIEINYGRLF